MTSLYIPDFSEMLAVSHSRGDDSEAPELWDDLELLLPIAAGGGLTAFDLSGSGRDGTLENMDPATAWVPSPSGGALDYDGGNDFLDTNKTRIGGTGLFCDANERFSVQIWARVAPGASGTILGRASATSSQRTFQLAFDSSDAAFSPFLKLRGIGAEFTGTSLNLDDGLWHSYHITWDGSLCQFYWDGNAFGSIDVGIAAEEGAQRIIVGARTNGTGFFVTGQVGLLAIWDQVRSFQDIQFLYNNPNALLQPRSRITFGEVEVEPEPPEVFLHDGRHNRIASIMSRMQATQRFRRIVRMPLDLSGDFAVIDGKVSIILAGDVINDVVMLQSKQREGDPSEGAYLHRETTFQVPTTGDLDPKVGDTVAVSGVSYRILDVRQPFLGDYWGLKTRELSITADTDLQDFITLFPAVHTSDAYGSKRTTHPAPSVEFANVLGKVQPKPATTEELAAKRGFKKTYWIYVSAELPTLKRGDLVKDQNSKQYTIESWTNRQRIDELSVIVCSTPPGS